MGSQKVGIADLLTEICLINYVSTYFSFIRFFVDRLKLNEKIAAVSDIYPIDFSNAVTVFAIHIGVTMVFIAPYS